MSRKLTLAAAAILVAPAAASAQMNEKDIVTVAVEALLQDKEALTRILTYHVVAGRVTAEQVVTLSKARTVAGIDAKIEVRDGNVYVAGSKVVTTDIMASNGIIHVIDTVMLPPM